ncbi:MAG: hypothetical protein M1829_001067 [Trizodia sp. TS-e1964]|nr:MAG: hypothetical protein M1829_001067 [Trizodia sp. TS-e1964]
MAQRILQALAILFALAALAQGTFIKLVISGGCVAIAQQFGDIITNPQCAGHGDYFIPPDMSSFIIYGSFDITSARRFLTPDCFHLVQMDDVRARGYDYLYIEDNWSLTASKPRSLFGNPWADRPKSVLLRWVVV